MEPGNQTEEGRLVPLTEEVLGHCTDCNRVRWLRVIDTEAPGFPVGTCRSCYREAEEGGSL